LVSPKMCGGAEGSMARILLYSVTWASTERIVTVC
jgi:hypothetical protein